MTKGNMPDPKGKLTGFPYEVIWEHLNPDWETFELDPEKLLKIEARFAIARAMGAPEQLCVELGQIDDILEPLNIADGPRKSLAHRLYWLAGVYLTRDHREFLGSDPAEVLDHITSLAKAAKSLDDALATLTPEGAAILSLVRPLMADALVRVPQFDFGTLGREAHDLALVAEQLVGDIPRFRRGRTANQMLEQWVWLATTAVEHYTDVKVRAPQSDTEGRNPRLEGTEGKVLLAYLRLVSRAMKEATIVRIIAKRRLARKAEPAS